jgi:O-antigen/teichoic acid export membrane protein
LKQSILTTRIPFVEAIKLRLAESPIAYRLARGAFWSLIGGIASRALTMGSSIIVARLLGKEGYGEVGMVQSTVGLFGIFAGIGLGATATKYVAEFRVKNPQKAGRICNLTIVVALMSGGLMMALSSVMSPWLGEKVLMRPDITPLLNSGAPLLFISTMGGVMLAVLTGFEAFRQIAKISIWQGIASPITTIPCVWFYGTEGAIASFTINAALGLAFSSFLVGHEYKKHNIPSKCENSAWSEWPVLWKFSLPALISGISFIPTMWIANVILARQDGGFGELGLFNAANQWRILIITLPGFLSSAMFPVISETHGLEDKSDFIKAVSLNFHIIWTVSFPLTIITIIAGKELTSFFGKQFSGTTPILAILMVAVFLNVVNNVVGVTLAGSGKMWIGALMNVGWSGVLIIASLIWIPSLGGFGLALAYLLAYLFHTLWQMAYVEIKLAPSSILSRWKLMLFSTVILGLSVQTSLFIPGSYLLKTVLVAASFGPLARMVRKSLHPVPV